MKALEEHTYASKRCPRRHGKALAPISQLPPETLSMILTFLSPSLCVGKAHYLPLLRVTMPAINDVKPNSAIPTPGIVYVVVGCHR